MTPQPAKPRILIVDDYEANLSAFRSVLESDYTVHTAESGIRALEETMRVEFAVILLDVRMPDMDGYETAEELRKREKTGHTPIIFTSAFDKTLATLQRGYVAGATDFLFSPVEPDLLKLKVATYVNTFQRAEALRLQVHHLTDIIRELRGELFKRGVVADGLKTRIRELEEAVELLEQQAALA